MQKAIDKFYDEKITVLTRFSEKFIFKYSIALLQNDINPNNYVPVDYNEYMCAWYHVCTFKNFRTAVIKKFKKAGIKADFTHHILTHNKYPYSTPKENCYVFTCDWHKDYNERRCVIL